MPLVGAAACPRCTALAVEALSLLVQSVMADSLYPPPLLRDLQSASAQGALWEPGGTLQLWNSSGAEAAASEPGGKAGGGGEEVAMGSAAEHALRALHQQAAVLREKQQQQKQQQQGSGDKQTGTDGNPESSSTTAPSPLLSVSASRSAKAAAPSTLPPQKERGDPGGRGGAAGAPRGGSLPLQGRLRVDRLSALWVRSTGDRLQVLLNVLVPKVRGHVCPSVHQPRLTFLHSCFPCYHRLSQCFHILPHRSVECLLGRASSWACQFNPLQDPTPARCCCCAREGLSLLRGLFRLLRCFS